MQSLISSTKSRRDLAFEKLLLRQQLAAMKHRQPRPKLSKVDWIFWVLFSNIWPNWRDALHIVAPDTVVRWHRQGFRYYWTWKSRRLGRPKVDLAIRVLFVLVILSHDRRRILHFNATEHPTAAWTARQLFEAFGLDDAPSFLLRDRDAIYGDLFRRQVASLKIKEVVTAPRSPWQNPYVERVIGSIRRECLDHTIVLGERHLVCDALTAGFNFRLAAS